MTCADGFCGATDCRRCMGADDRSRMKSAMDKAKARLSQVPS